MIDCRKILSLYFDGISQRKINFQHMTRPKYCFRSHSMNYIRTYREGSSQGIKDKKIMKCICHFVFINTAINKLTSSMETPIH